jgi:hypothetical protein
MIIGLFFLDRSLSLISLALHRPGGTNRWAAQRYHEIQRGEFDYFSNPSETTRLDGFHYA